MTEETSVSWFTASAAGVTGGSPLAISDPLSAIRFSYTKWMAPPASARPLPWFELSLNLLPLVGVLFLDWRLFDVMLVYWFESALILITGMLRVLWIGEQPVRNALGMLLFSPIYLGPAAGCVAGYGIAVVALFYGPAPMETWEHFPRMTELKALIVDEWLWVPIAALSVSYVGDFAKNWILSGAYRTASTVGAMLALYGRVILFQVLTVSIAAVLIKTGQGVLALAFLVAVKTFMDLALHVWRDRREDRASHLEPVELSPGELRR